MSNNLTVQEMDVYAMNIVNSGFCGFKNKSEVITLALIAQDEGRSIGSVARDYHIINGRPALKADAMLARYQAAGGKVEWMEISNNRCSAKFTHPNSGTFELSWTIEDATKAGITSNPTWKKYPRAMLRARVISEGIRTSFPAVICGTYTPEECEDMEPVKQPVQANKPERKQANKPEAVEAEVVQPSEDEARANFESAMAELAARSPDAYAQAMRDTAKNLTPEQIAPEKRREVYKAVKAAVEAANV